MLILWNIFGASCFSILFSIESFFMMFKGIDRSFELSSEIRLIRSVMTNWRLGNFFYLILNGLHHKISKNQ
jgi:hypothetical protein